MPIYSKIQNFLNGQNNGQKMFFLKIWWRISSNGTKTNLHVKNILAKLAKLLKSIFSRVTPKLSINASVRVVTCCNILVIVANLYLIHIYQAHIVANKVA